MFKFVLKPSQLIGGPPTYRYPIFAHSVELQTLRTNRGPPTLAISVASSNLVRRYIYIW